VTSGYVAHGKAHIEAHLDGWVAVYDGMAQGWCARSPGFRLDGVCVCAPSPEETVERVRLLLATGWSPSEPEAE
jgi:hypothetical protein